MAEKLGLDNEVHELILGTSFLKGAPEAYHSIRYDFKPASVDMTQVANVDIGEGNSVMVTVPHVEGSGTTHTVYKGNKRPCQKECVLIIDHQTGQITLEKLGTNIHLKKTSVTLTTSGRSASLNKTKNIPSSRSSSVVRAQRSESNKLSATNNSKNDSELVLSDLEITLEDRELRASESARSTHSCHGDTPLMKFTKSINGKIRKFLSKHQMDTTRRPYVCGAYSISRFQHEHPKLYADVLQMISINNDDFDDLSSYLCKTYSDFLVHPRNIYGSLQRLEDLITFILGKFKKTSSLIKYVS